MSDTSVLEHVDTRTSPITKPSAGDGDHERFAHYVRKDLLSAAIFSGVPAVAICGKRWLPTKDPSRFPICPDCKAVYEQMQAGDPDSPDYKG